MPHKPKTHNAANTSANRKAYDKARGSSRARGYSTAWDRYSRARLIEHPLCVRCFEQGLKVLATVTDHVQPARQFPLLFWDEANHASLCASHNAAKAHEDAKKYR